MAVNKVWAFIGLTGGTSDALDSVSVSSLLANDFAWVQNLGITYFYKYSSVSSDSENSPYVIKPDDAGATGRWLLQGSYGTVFENELINSNFRINQDVYNYSSSISAGNYFFDGWFNKNGNSSHSVSFDTGGNGGLIPGTAGISQLYGHRKFISGTQISGIEQNEIMTISMLLDSGTISVYAGYGTNSSSALSLGYVGDITTTTTYLNFNAAFGGSESTYLAVELRGTSPIQYVKIERGSFPSKYIEPNFIKELSICQRFYQKTYNYSVAPGAVTTNGAISFRNMTGGASATHSNIPAKVGKMHSTPSITIYSPNSGNSGNIYDTTAMADVAVSGVVDNGENGFSTLVTAATIASNNLGRFHYVFDARL